MPIRRSRDCRAVELAIGCRARTGCQGQEGHEADLRSAFLWLQHTQLSEKQPQEPAHVPAWDISFSVLSAEKHRTNRSSEKAIPAIWATLPGPEAAKTAIGAEERMDTQGLHLHTHTHTPSWLLPQFGINPNVWSSVSGGWYLRWKHSVHRPCPHFRH